MSLKAIRKARRREREDRISAAYLAKIRDLEDEDKKPGLTVLGVDLVEGSDMSPLPVVPQQEAPMQGWKKWFVYSRRFWLIIAPLIAELVVWLGVAIHVFPQSADDALKKDVAQYILRGLEAIGAYYVFKADIPLTLSYKASGGVPEAPFHQVS